ncbi:MAG: DNA internalization-related competence protein ComEC/Rec2 [Comamonas sp.]
MRLSPTFWALAAAAGVALQLLQPALWQGWHYGALGGVATLCGVIALRTRQRARTPWARHGLAAAVVAAVAVAVAVAAFALTGWQALGRQAQRIAPALEGVDLQVVAVVDAMPTRSAQGLRMRLAVEQARQADGQSVALPDRLEVTWYTPRGDGAAALPAVAAGERWCWTLRLKAPHGARNPHGWDWELWLWAQGMGATGYVRDGANHAAPERLNAAEGRRPVEALRQQVRDAIVAQGAGHATVEGEADAANDRRRAFGVVAALVTGDQRSIDTADWEVFRRTGVAHLVSISGLHITMFAWLAMRLLGALWRCSTRLCRWWPAPLAALWGGVVLAAAYALFSGWGLPAQRTVGMLAVVALLHSGGWRWPWWAVWSVVLAVIALWDPWALCQAGFWLSFVAVGGLLASGSAASQQGTWRQRLYQLLREQWVVVLALSPLSLLFFGQVSLVGGLANLLAIPWVTLVVTPLSLLGVFWHQLWEAAAWCVQAMVGVLEVLSAWPGASFTRAQAPWWAAAAAIAGGVGLVLPVPWQWKTLALPLLWPALWWQAPRPAPGELDMLALDVGQGSAVLLRTAHHSLLFDAGPAWPGGDAGARVVQPLLQALGERLDVLVLSHGDADHVGGAEAVLAQQPQARLMGAGAAAVAQRLSRPWQPCVAGQQWEWDGVLWQVLHPAAGEQGDGNAASCVLRVQAANGAAVLLTGDIEAAQEAQLLRSGQNLRADVLLAPHHGSRTSSSAAFLAAVAPHTVVVQAGYRNRFGHPAAPVLQRYAAQHMRVQSTPQCGAVHWNGVPAQPVQCERSLHPHYWSCAPTR